MTYGIESILSLWHRANTIIHLVSVVNYSNKIRVIGEGGYHFIFLCMHLSNSLKRLIAEPEGEVTNLDGQVAERLYIYSASCNLLH